MADLINMLFGVVGQVCPRNHKLELPHRNGQIFVKWSIANEEEFSIDHAKTDKPIDMRFGMVSGVDPQNCVSDGCIH